MNRTMLAAAAFGACLFAIGAEAQAAQYWPYCLRDGYSGSVTCGFSSFQQCLATRTGTSDCMANPLPPPAAPRATRARR